LITLNCLACSVSLGPSLKSIHNHYFHKAYSIKTMYSDES
jgi:hypothetical protein